MLIGLGKVLGFFKDLSLSYYLGANGTTDAYFVSVYAAGLLYGGIYSAIPLLIVPNASESNLNMRNQEIAISSMAIFLTTMFLSVVVFYFSDIVAGIFLADSIDEAVTTASYYIRIAAVTFPLSALTLIATSIRLADGEKIPSNVIAIFNSSLFIGAVYFWHSADNFKYVLYSTIFSWFLLVFCYGKPIIFLIKYLEWSLRNLSFDRFLLLFRTSKIFYLDQVTPAVALYFAAQCGGSFVSLFSYSNKLFLLYITISVVFVNSYLVPRFAKAYASGLRSISGFDSDFTKLMMIVFPLTLFTLANSEYLVSLVFDRGEITYEQLGIITNLFDILLLAIPCMVVKDIVTKIILINREPVPLAFIQLSAILFNVVFCSIAIPQFSIFAVGLGYFLSILLVCMVLILSGQTRSWITRRSKINFVSSYSLICVLSFSGIDGVLVENVGGLNLLLFTGVILMIWYHTVLKKYFKINLIKS